MLISTLVWNYSRKILKFSRTALELFSKCSRMFMGQLLNFVPMYFMYNITRSRKVLDL